MATKDPAHHYDSNPFTLAFDALGRLFKTNVGWAIVLIAVGFIGFLFQLISTIIDVATSPESERPEYLSETISTGQTPETWVIVAIIAGILAAVAIFMVISALIQTALIGMFTYVTIQSEQGKSVSFSESFNAMTKRFWRLFWAKLLADLKILGWTLLLIVPGIIAALRYSLLPYLIMNESETEKGVVDAHDKVKSVVKGRLWEVFGVGTVAAIIPFVGSTLGIVGRGALYRQLQYHHDKKLERPKVHWLNYLGAILLSVLFFMLLGLIVLLLTVFSFT